MPNYVEPFFGSGAVLLGRPHAPKNETVNDLDAYLSNFFRATAYDPDEVAKWADWPVSEVDLCARHLWLVNQPDFVEQMRRDPEFYDARIAGWWVWGISQWIGSGWCTRPEWAGRSGAYSHPRGLNGEQWRKRPRLEKGGSGVHRVSHVVQKRPQAGNGGHGVFRVKQQMPAISGDSGASGRGINAKYCEDLYTYFDALGDRLRRVRICCGDWMRILGPSATTHIGVTAVLLDPPYSVERDTVYSQESMFLSHEVAEWAIHNGDNPQFRIALCGYEGEHVMPASWECIEWKANGGYGNQSADGRGRANATRERVWFSPHCIRPPQK